MEYFKIALRPKKQLVSVAYCEGLIWESFNILRKNGHEVSNGDFFKIGIPFTLAAIVPAYVLIWLLFGV